MNIASENTDDFVKNIVKIASLEKPGDEFIPSLMSKIEGLNAANNKLTVTSPIISWKGWVTIGAIIIIIFTLLLVFDSSTLSFSVFTQYIDRIVIQPITIPISGTFLMGVFAFVFFFIIQLFLSVNKLNENESV